MSAADNWDHLERTVDGYNTTHAMTSIFIQKQQDHPETQPCRIPKSDARALPLEAGTCYIVPYTRSCVEFFGFVFILHLVEMLICWYLLFHVPNWVVTEITVQEKRYFIKVMSCLFRIKF